MKKIKTASNYEIDTPAIVDGREEASEAGVCEILSCLFFFFLFFSFFSFLFFLLGRSTLQRKTRQYIEK